MYKIWDRNPWIKVRGHWPLWRGWTKWMPMQTWQKSNANKN